MIQPGDFDRLPVPPELRKLVEARATRSGRTLEEELMAMALETLDRLYGDRELPEGWDL